MLKKAQNNNRMEMQVIFAINFKPMPASLDTRAYNLHYFELHAVGSKDWSTGKKNNIGANHFSVHSCLLK